MLRPLFLLLTLAALFITAGATPIMAAPSSRINEVDAKIEIVWPQGNLPVQQATRANITVYLFEPDSLRSVPCDFNPTVRLWRALNNNPASNAGMPLGEKRFVTRGNITFPVWDFNNVDVSAARDPFNKLYFYATVDGVTTNFNVWTHGADARTYLPDPKRPAGVEARPEAVDARIQVVWPHDRAGNAQPVSRATLANVTVALFHAIAPHINDSVDTGFNQRVYLYKALNNEPMQLVGTGAKRIVRERGLTYPVWDFNDVDVAAARDPLNKYYFRVWAQDTRTFSTIWSHGADARTYFPQPDRPTAGCRAASVSPSLTINPTSGWAGTNVTLEASGFPAGAALEAWAALPNAEGILIGRERADSNGEWTLTWQAQGAVGQRWTFAVNTVAPRDQDRIRAEAGPFIIIRR